MTDLDGHATNLVDAVYGRERHALDDPGETWFEASRIARASLPWDAPGVATLLRSPLLQRVAQRPGRRYPHRPAVALPAPALVPGTLADALDARTSADVLAPGPIRLDQLAALLQTAVGSVERPTGRRRRAPSGGALYPIDAVVLARDVDGLDRGVYAADPDAGELRHLRELDDDAFLSGSLRPEAVEGAACAIVLTASFWRSRFKYGTRAYRFALLEAGHIAQNLLLVATALGLASRPYGGFVDDELEAVVGELDGVDDAVVLFVVVGAGAAS